MHLTFIARIHSSLYINSKPLFIQVLRHHLPAESVVLITRNGWSLPEYRGKGSLESSGPLGFLKCKMSRIDV